MHRARLSCARIHARRPLTSGQALVLDGQCGQRHPRRVLSANGRSHFWLKSPTGCQRRRFTAAVDMSRGGIRDEARSTDTGEMGTNRIELGAVKTLLETRKLSLENPPLPSELTQLLKNVASRTQPQAIHELLQYCEANHPKLFLSHYESLSDALANQRMWSELTRLLLLAQKHAGSSPPTLLLRLVRDAERSHDSNALADLVLFCKKNGQFVTPNLTDAFATASAALGHVGTVERLLEELESDQSAVQSSQAGPSTGIPAVVSEVSDSSPTILDTSPFSLPHIEGKSDLIWGPGTTPDCAPLPPTPDETLIASNATLYHLAGTRQPKAFLDHLAQMTRFHDAWSEATLAAAMRFAVTEGGVELDQAFTLFANSLLSGVEEDIRAFCKDANVSHELQFDPWIVERLAKVKPSTRILNYLLLHSSRSRYALTDDALMTSLYRFELLLLHATARGITADIWTARTFLDFLSSSARMGPQFLANVAGELSELESNRPRSDKVASPHPESTADAFSESESKSLLLHNVARRRIIGIISKGVKWNSSKRDVGRAARAACFPLAPPQTAPPLSAGSASASLPNDVVSKTARSEDYELRIWEASLPPVAGMKWNWRGAQRAQAVFDEMVANGFRPTKRHFLALMRQYINAGHMDKATNILSKALFAGVLCTAAMITVLIDGYGKQGRPDIAERTLLMLNNTKMAARPLIDIGSIDALARGYISAGRKAHAKRVIEQHWEAITPSSAGKVPTRRFSNLSARLLLSALQSVGKKKDNSTFNKARRDAVKMVVRRIVRSWGTTEGVPAVPRPLVRRSWK